MSKAAKRERQRQNRLARREAEEQWLKRRKALRTARNIAIPLVLVLVVAIGWNILRDDGSNDSADTSTTTVAPVDLPEGCMLDAPPPMELVDGAAYAATVETPQGSFEMSLDAVSAPQTVNAFVYSARNGCYDGLTFHRIEPEFVIQGGDPLGVGQGDFGYELPDEPPAAPYTTGSVAMANAGSGTTGSQFFVVLNDEAATRLVQLGASQPDDAGDPGLLYSGLGQVTSGMEVVLDIAAQQPPVEIISITVTENGELLGPTVAADDTPDDTAPATDDSVPADSTDTTDPATPPEETTPPEGE